MKNYPTTPLTKSRKISRKRAAYK